MNNAKKVALIFVTAGMAAGAAADADPDGTALRSPGAASGNVIQVPVHVPANLCDNTVDVIGALNPAFGNTCADQ